MEQGGDLRSVTAPGRGRIRGIGRGRRIPQYLEEEDECEYEGPFLGSPTFDPVTSTSTSQDMAPSSSKQGSKSNDQGPSGSSSSSMQRASSSRAVDVDLEVDPVTSTSRATTSEAEQAANLPVYDLSQLNNPRPGHSDSEDSVDMSSSTHRRSRRKKCPRQRYKVKGQPRVIINHPIPDHRRDTSIQILGGPKGPVFTSGLLLAKELDSIENFAHRKLLAQGIENCHITEFNSLQRTLVPHLYRGDDIFIIGGGKNGKTLAYLIPMIGALLTMGRVRSERGESTGSKFTLHRPPGSNPSLIIICADILSATRVKDQVFALLRPINSHDLTYDVVGGNKDLFRLRTGLAIIITTITFFHETIVDRPNFIGFNELKYLVYEDLDTLSHFKHKEFEAVRRIMNEMAAANPYACYQRVFSGQKWGPNVEMLYFSVNPLIHDKSVVDPEEDEEPGGSAPTLFINSMNQIIKYAEVGWYFHHAVDDGEKIGKLKELLKSIGLYPHRKIFVLCSTADVASSVYNNLDEPGLGSMSLATTKSTKFDMFNQLKSEWSGCQTESQQIMVTHDEALMNLNIDTVSCLIHYDLPTPTFQSNDPNGFNNITTRGAERFSCMSKNFRSIALEKVDPDTKHQRMPIESHFLLLGTEPVLPKLRKFGASLLRGIPESINIIADNMEVHAKRGEELCVGSKIFGKCLTFGCKGRHSLFHSEVAKPPLVPRSCWVEIQVAEVVNPSLYMGRVLRIYELNTKGGKRVIKESWIHSFNKIQDKLKAYFSSENGPNEDDHNPRRIPPNSYEPGTLVVVDCGAFGQFRARILAIVSREDNLFPRTLRVFCIDTGYLYLPMATAVYALPSDLTLEKEPQLALEMVLCNLKSPESESSYPGKVKGIAAEITVNKILMAQVRLAVGGTAWAYPLIDEGAAGVDPQCARRALQPTPTRSSIRLELIRRGIAENNPEHLNQILKLGRDTGFRCLELEDLRDNPMRDVAFMAQFYKVGDPRPFWAFVPVSHDADKPRSIEVFGTFTIDSYTIFGTLRKFTDLLDGLNEELDSEVERHIEGRCSEYGRQFESWYRPGLVVAVRDRYSKKWIRGLIMRVDHGSGPGLGESGYEVFFVDVGDSQTQTRPSELFPMPRKYVDKLPFQAIAFRLDHISPLGHGEGVPEWRKEDVDKLLALTLDENDGVLFDVVAFDGDVEKDWNRIPCHYYPAFLITSGGREVGEILVREGVAIFNEDGAEKVTRVRSSLLRQLNARFDQLMKGMDRDRGVEEMEVIEEEEEEETGFDIVGYNTFEQTCEGMGLEVPEILKQNVIEPPTLSRGTLTQGQEGQRQGQDPSPPSPGPSSSTSTPELDPPVSGFSSLRHPTVIWSETPSVLILQVELADVTEYSLKLDESDPKLLSFRCIRPHPDHGFDLPCPAALVLYPTHPPEVTLLGQAIQIRVTKKTRWLWNGFGNKKLRPWLKKKIKDDKDDEDELAKEVKNQIIFASLKKRLDKRLWVQRKPDPVEVNEIDSDDSGDELVIRERLCD